MKALYLASALTKSWLRNRGGLFFSLIFPVLLLLIFGSIFGNPQNINYNLYVQNKDLDQNGNPTQISQILIHSLNESKIFKISTISIDKDPLSFARESGIFEQRRVLVIPKGFGSYVQNYTEKLAIEREMARINEVLKLPYLNDTQRAYLQDLLNVMKNRLSQIKIQNVSLEIYITKADPAYDQLINLLYNFIQRFGSYASGSALEIQISEKEIGIKPLNASDYYISAYITLTIMSNALFGLTGVISDMRRRGILKRIVATTISKWEWFLAIFLNQFVICLIASFLLILVGISVYHVSFVLQPYSLFLDILLISLGVFSFSSIGIVIGTVFKQPDTAGTIGSAIGFPMMFLSGIFFPVEIMPSYLQIIASLLPTYYLNVGLRESTILGIYNLTPISIIILAAISIVFFSLAIKLTKWGSE